MNRLFWIAVVAAVAAPAWAAGAERPNVLLICVDDLKPLLGCYGDATVRSPNIDRLAARGVTFDHAYCNQAVCSPSRNALMTGLRPQRLGIYDLPTHFRLAAPDAVTLAQYFRQHGYRSEGLGKILHVGHGNHEDPLSWSVPHWRPKGGGYLLPENVEGVRERVAKARAEGLPQAKISTLAKGPATEAADVPDSAYPDGQIADEAVRRIESAAEKPDEPFFLAVGFLKPHLPFCAPKKYWELYDEASFPLPELDHPPEGAPEFAPTTWGELRNYSDIPATGALDDAATRHLIHGYHAAVSYMDAQLGRVLDALDRSGLAGRTIVVLWGDHGWHLGDHGMWCKHTNYEQAARIPLIVAAPGVTPPDAHAAALAETVDLYPTLCELAGLPAPEGLDGTSFVPVLKDPSADAKEAVLHVYPRGPLLGRAVRTARYRLVEWKAIGDPAETAVLELYDYQADPAETKNLADERPEVVEQLRVVLARQPEAVPQFRAAGEAKPASRPKQDRAAMFRHRDRDGNGRLTPEEFLIGQPDPEEAPKRFPRFDTDGDGLLTQDEFVYAGKKPSR